MPGHTLPAVVVFFSKYFWHTIYKIKENLQSPGSLKTYLPGRKQKNKKENWKLKSKKQ